MFALTRRRTRTPPTRARRSCSSSCSACAPWPRPSRSRSACPSSSAGACASADRPRTRPRSFPPPRRRRPRRLNPHLLPRRAPLRRQRPRRLPTLVGVARVAHREVVVVEIGIDPSGLRHDPAEPALAAAVDGAVEEGRFLPFGRTRRRERCRAITFRRRGRSIEIRLVTEVLLVVGPRRARVVAAVLRGRLRMLQSSHTCEAREEDSDSNLHCRAGRRVRR